MKATLWARRMVYLCALTGALMGQLFDIGWIFHYIFFFMLTLPILSLLLSLPGILGLRLRLSASAHETPRGSQASWSLTAGSRFGFPVSRVTGRVKLRCPFTGESRAFPIALRGAAPGVSFSWELDTGHCGMVICSVSRLRAWDNLGLFALPLRQIPSGTLFIVPLPEEPLRLVLPDSNGSTVPVSGGRPAMGEDYELRPYRDGDSLRTVHWKMSAKRDELVTRERLAENYPLPVLTFNHFGDADGMDRILDRLAGYSRVLLERERPFAVRWVHPHTGAVRQYAVSCEREWSACLTAIFADPAPGEGMGVGTIDGPDGIYQIHITGEPPCSNA